MKHYKNIMTHLSGIVEDMGTYRGIQEICILFPTMKPLEKNDGANTKSEGENQAVVTRNVSTNSARIDLSKVKIEPLFEEFVDFETFAKSDFRVVKSNPVKRSKSLKSC